MTPSNMISVIVATFFVVFMQARRYFSALLCSQAKRFAKLSGSKDHWTINSHFPFEGCTRTRAERADSVSHPLGANLLGPYLATTTFDIGKDSVGIEDGVFCFFRTDMAPSEVIAASS